VHTLDLGLAVFAMKFLEGWKNETWITVRPSVLPAKIPSVFVLVLSPHSLEYCERVEVSKYILF
jgi:hypothetical protein